MRSELILFLMLLSFISIKAKSQTNDQVPTVNFEEFEPWLHKTNDTVYVLNFWATWCIPCRKELPEFERIYKDLASDLNVKVLLVSLDFASKKESSLIPFLEKNNISAPVILLSDPDGNSWINKVDKNWSGSLPATVIYKNSERSFFEEELEYSTIYQTINELNKL